MVRDKLEGVEVVKEVGYMRLVKTQGRSNKNYKAGLFNFYRLPILYVTNMRCHSRMRSRFWNKRRALTEEDRVERWVGYRLVRIRCLNVVVVVGGWDSLSRWQRAYRSSSYFRFQEREPWDVNSTKDEKKWVCEKDMTRREHERLRSWWSNWRREYIWDEW